MAPELSFTVPSPRLATFFAHPGDQEGQRAFVGQGTLPAGTFTLHNARGLTPLLDKALSAHPCNTLLGGLRVTVPQSAALSLQGRAMSSGDYVSGVSLAALNTAANSVAWVTCTALLGAFVGVVACSGQTVAMGSSTALISAMAFVALACIIPQSHQAQQTPCDGLSVSLSSEPAMTIVPGGWLKDVATVELRGVTLRPGRGPALQGTLHVLGCAVGLAFITNILDTVQWGTSLAMPAAAKVSAWGTPMLSSSLGNIEILPKSAVRVYGETLGAKPGAAQAQGAAAVVLDTGGDTKTVRLRVTSELLANPMLDITLSPFIALPQELDGSLAPMRVMVAGSVNGGSAQELFELVQNLAGNKAAALMGLAGEALGHEFFFEASMNKKTLSEMLLGLDQAA